MRRVDRWLTKWADAELELCHKSNYSGINVVERILRDPGIATDKSQDRVLWWPRNKAISRVSKASHQLTPTERIVLIIHYGFVKNDDGTRMTKKELSKCSSIDVARFGRILRDAKNKIIRILRGYDKEGLDR